MALRTIETDGLKCLGPEEFGPWRLGDDRLLRASSNMVPLQTEAEAQAVFDTYHAAYLAGAPTPDALEVVRVNDGYGVVVEYVPGLPLGSHVLIGSYSIEEAGHAMGELARELHAVRMDAGRDWNTLFAQRAREFATLMSPESGEKLVSLVEKIPPSNALIHGDLHVVNVVVLDGVCRLIDMEAAGYGHPVLELAIALSRLEAAANRLAVSLGIDRDESDRIWHRMWLALLKGYFDGAGESELNDLNQRLEVLGKVELCRQICANPESDSGHLSDYQRKRVIAMVRRVEELLPNIERLDF